jgi:hypothetical protein
VAAIKKLYTSPKTHHGKYHKPCDPLKCNEKECGCGNCGSIGNEINCGYQGGFNGHWTCCVAVSENSECNTTHSGFWHGKCIGYECTSQKCGCGNCGGGCTY